MAEPAGDVAGIVQQNEDAGPLNSSKAEEEAGVGFQEVAEQAKGQVGNHEKFEGVAGEEAAAGFFGKVGILRLRRHFASLRHGSAQDDSFRREGNFILKRNFFQDAVEEGDQGQQEEDFVELGGMARNAVAEVYGPGKIARDAVGVVGEAGEETADASDGDAEGERDGVEVAGRGAKSDVALHPFDREQAEDERADDGLASNEVGGIAEVVPGKCGVFEPVQKLRAERGSGDGCRDDRPAERRRDGISEAAAERQVNAEGDEVGERFEKEMGMDDVAAEVQVIGEQQRELGQWKDGGIIARAGARPATLPRCRDRRASGYRRRGPDRSAASDSGIGRSRKNVRPAIRGCGR